MSGEEKTTEGSKELNPTVIVNEESITTTTERSSCIDKVDDKTKRFHDEEEPCFYDANTSFASGESSYFSPQGVGDNEVVGENAAEITNKVIGKLISNKICIPYPVRSKLMSESVTNSPNGSICVTPKGVLNDTFNISALADSLKALSMSDTFEIPNTSLTQLSTNNDSEEINISTSTPLQNDLNAQECEEIEVNKEIPQPLFDVSVLENLNLASILNPMHNFNAGTQSSDTNGNLEVKDENRLLDLTDLDLPALSNSDPSLNDTLPCENGENNAEKTLEINGNSNILDLSPECLEKFTCGSSASAIDLFTSSNHTEQDDRRVSKSQILLDLSDETHIPFPQTLMLGAEIDDTFGIFNSQVSSSTSSKNISNLNQTPGPFKSVRRKTMLKKLSQGTPLMTFSPMSKSFSELMKEEEEGFDCNSIQEENNEIELIEAFSEMEVRESVEHLVQSVAISVSENEEKAKDNENENGVNEAKVEEVSEKEDKIEEINHEEAKIEESVEEEVNLQKSATPSPNSNTKFSSGPKCCLSPFTELSDSVFSHDAEKVAAEADMELFKKLQDESDIFETDEMREFESYQDELEVDVHDLLEEFKEQIASIVRLIKGDQKVPEPPPQELRPFVKRAYQTSFEEWKRKTIDDYLKSFDDECEFYITASLRPPSFGKNEPLGSESSENIENIENIESEAMEKYEVGDGEEDNVRENILNKTQTISVGDDLVEHSVESKKGENLNLTQTLMSSEDGKSGMEAYGTPKMLSSKKHKSKTLSTTFSTSLANSPCTRKLTFSSSSESLNESDTHFLPSSTSLPKSGQKLLPLPPSFKFKKGGGSDNKSSHANLKPFKALPEITLAPSETVEPFVRGSSKVPGSAPVYRKALYRPPIAASSPKPKEETERSSSRGNSSFSSCSSYKTSANASFSSVKSTGYGQRGGGGGANASFNTSLTSNSKTPKKESSGNRSFRAGASSPSILLGKLDNNEMRDESTRKPEEGIKRELKRTASASKVDDLRVRPQTASGLSKENRPNINKFGFRKK